MSFLSIVAAVFVFFLNLFKDWLYIFYISFNNKDTVWIIIPIWMSWFFAEFFQEKRGTSFGNAISNGVVPLWVGIDWLRQLTNQLVGLNSRLTLGIFTKYMISSLVIIYGFLIVFLGIKGKWFIRYIGRIRAVTYILAVLTPVIYGLVKLDAGYFLEVILFFPLFYFLIEGIDQLTPEPKIYAQDRKIT